MNRIIVEFLAEDILNTMRLDLVWAQIEKGSVCRSFTDDYVHIKLCLPRILISARKHGLMIPGQLRNNRLNLGSVVSHTLLHEIRHVQQLHDPTLPQVSPLNRGVTTMEEFRKYIVDPGEQDAEQFAKANITKIAENVLFDVGSFSLKWGIDHMQKHIEFCESYKPF